MPIVIESQNVNDTTVWKVGYEGRTQFIRKTPSCVMDVVTTLLAKSPESPVFFTIR
jgi:hypothetical protein